MPGMRSLNVVITYIERRLQHAQVDINFTNLVLGTVMCFWTCFKYVVPDVKVVMCSQNIYALICHGGLHDAVLDLTLYLILCDVI